MEKKISEHYPKPEDDTIPQEIVHRHSPSCNHDHHHELCGHSASAPLKKIYEIGRNDLCHCGSGKKFKKCCL